MKKRALSLLLTLCMALSLLPTAALGADLTPLDTPTELMWGTEDGGKTQLPMAMCWRIPANNQERYRLEIYRVGEDAPVATVYPYFPAGMSEWGFSNYFTEISEDRFDSGAYYFTVQCLGDNTKYGDSAVATSETINYVKPTSRLGTPTQLTWDWPMATAAQPAVNENIGGYMFDFFYSEEEDTEEEFRNPIGSSIQWTKNLDADDVLWTFLEDFWIEENGSGYYWFKVRLLTNDITAKLNGRWTDFSPVYHHDLDGVKAKLEDIYNNLWDPDWDPDEARAAVQALDPIELEQAMLSDPDVVDMLNELENEILGENPITVDTTNAPEGMPKDGASIVGAGLNNVTGNVKLTVAAASKNDLKIPPTLTHNTMNIRFSMNLSGVEDPEDLKVPVLLTLPVPDGINPDFLHIVHYFADGTYQILKNEDLWPFQEDGKTFVSFVLNSFSDFALMVADPDQAPAAKPLVITGVELKPKTYDGTTDAEVAAVSFDGLDSGETLSLGADYTVAAKFADAKAGENKKVTAEVTLTNGGYSLAEGTFETTADISQATVTVTAEDKAVYVGASAPAYTVKTAGFVGQDGWETAPTVSCPTADLSKVGTYPIVPSGGTLKAGVEESNYKIEYREGVLTVSAKNSGDSGSSESGGGSSSSESGSSGSSSGGGSSSGSSSSSGSFGSNTISVPDKPDHGQVVSDKNRAKKGDTVTLTVTPEEGYRLDKLTVADKNGQKVVFKKLSEDQFSFVMPGRKVEVKASFVMEPEETEPVVVPSVADRFRDIEPTGWYKDAIQYVYDRGMMTGMTAEEFGPDEATSRGMLVTILYRLEQEPEIGPADFDDVAGTAYYASPIAWAAQEELVTGFESGLFQPNQKITREQLVTILYRYAQWKGLDTSKGESTEFPDGASIQSYAKQAVEWAAGIGLVNGYQDGSFRPEGAATRAEVAAMLMRLCGDMGEGEN